MSEPLAHTWRLRSRHRTSEGEVRYESCRCGAHRIRIDRAAAAPADLAHPRPA